MAGRGTGTARAARSEPLFPFLTFLLSGGKDPSLSERNVALLFTPDIPLLLDCHTHPSSLPMSRPPSPTYREAKDRPPPSASPAVLLLTG